jgi:glycerol-3-phosphate acyltransferase PlsX
VLIGLEDAMRQALGETLPDRMVLRACGSVIETGEQPLKAIRDKKDSSLVLGLNMVRDGEADAFITAGSTGAAMSGALFNVGRIKGIHRPALAPVLPTLKGHAMLIDCGANPDCKPEYLVQFAAMGAAYMSAVENVDNPRVALINIGAEEEKGSELYRSVHQLLKASKLNFVGNIEPRDVLNGDADVLVCDGFAGNMVLKTMEGTVGYLMTNIRTALMESYKTKVGALLIKGAMRQVKRKLDYTEYGGAPLLGVNGVVIKAHGNSTAHSFANAIDQVVHCVERDVPGRIKKALED